MALERRPAVDIPAGVTLERVADAAGHGRWREAVLDGFAEDSQTDRDAVTSAFADDTSLIGGPIAAFVASVEERPAGAAMSHTEGGAGFVGWVGTVPAFRRRGLGGLVTAAASAASFDAGAGIVTLQASDMGEPVYRRLGYETIGAYRLWGR
jgi:predicted GNAT family acetyltransferase